MACYFYHEEYGILSTNFVNFFTVWRDKTNYKAYSSVLSLSISH